MTRHRRVIAYIGDANDVCRSLAASAASSVRANEQAAAP